MWCPNCKNEYIAGITRCADCGIALVDSLELYEASPEKSSEAFYQEVTEGVMDSKDLSVFDSPSGNSAPKADNAHAYVSKASQKDNMRSTAYTFTLVGIGGLILLVLLAFGILPIHMLESTKIMMYIVMGAMFVIFLFIGIRAFGQIKKLGDEAIQEEQLRKEITEWFLGTYGADNIDASVDISQPEEMLYFSRYDTMKQLILEKYPDLEEAFLDHMIEAFYAEIF